MFIGAISSLFPDGFTLKQLGQGEEPMTAAVLFQPLPQTPSLRCSLSPWERRIHSSAFLFIHLLIFSKCLLSDRTILAELTGIPSTVLRCLQWKTNMIALSCICERDRAGRRESYFPKDSVDRVCTDNCTPGLSDLGTVTDSKGRESSSICHTKNNAWWAATHSAPCAVVKESKVVQTGTIKGCDKIMVS